MGACYEHLGYVERLAIADEQRRGLSIRAIARMLKRSPSTVSRELRRMEPHWQGYNPAQALFRALARRRESRQGACKLIPASPLFAHVAGALCEGWSPSQIAGRLRRMDPAARPGTFFANRAAEQAEAKKIADATKFDLLATIAERDRNAPGSADYIRLNAGKALYFLWPQSASKARLCKSLPNPPARLRSKPLKTLCHARAAITRHTVTLITVRVIGQMSHRCHPIFVIG